MTRTGRWAMPALAAAIITGQAAIVSARAEDRQPGAQFIAHRGVHQNFDLAGIDSDTCTATRIREPIVPEIENTIASMRAAFAAGADVVELDVHPTTDGRFVVFHDWTLDCRTDGAGETRSHDMAYLKGLDVGYGYTADNGETFPLRGTGVGLMPSLDEVLTAFPDGKFFINFKSNEAREGDMLADFLSQHPEWRDAVWGVYGGTAPTQRAVELVPGLRGYTAEVMASCLMPYMAGKVENGTVPEGCRNTLVPLPINFAARMPGWPERFQAELAEAGSTIILYGPYEQGDAGASGIDTAEQAALIPDSFTGFVSTNEIQRVNRVVGSQMR